MQSNSALRQDRNPQSGKFLPGNSGMWDRRKPNLDAALRDKTDPEKLADRLLEIALKPGSRDQQRAIEYIYNRLAGAPRQSVSLSVDEDDPGVLAMRALWARFSEPAIEAESVKEITDGHT